MAEIEEKLIRKLIEEEINYLEKEIQRYKEKLAYKIGQLSNLEVTSKGKKTDEY